MPLDITSAALYFTPTSMRSVPQSWVEGAFASLERMGLPAQEFALTTTDRDTAGPREFGKQRSLATRRRSLERELNRNNISVLGLYANPERRSDLVMDWYGLAYIDMDGGHCFLGLPREKMPSPTEMLRSAYALYAGIPDPLYGIAYFHDRQKGPDFYAIGFLANWPEVVFDAEAMAAGDRISKWAHEGSGGRRYLRGWFRQAYPANLLSQAHVDAPLGDDLTLRTANIGRLTPLDSGRWLWELEDEEIPVAEAALAKARLLICS